MKLRLSQIAHARSGDKADRADLGLFAWDARGYALLDRYVTPARVADHFAHLMAEPGESSVRCYRLPQLMAQKWLLEHALNGGAASSLRSDNLGKTLSALMLRLEIEVDDAEGQMAISSARAIVEAFGPC